jgi:hypothetical protein
MDFQPGHGLPLLGWLKLSFLCVDGLGNVSIMCECDFNKLYGEVGCGG